uniref:Doublecortin domain-containing protein n=1 Tax=Gongylonema pulchrum TaxID=637853 RepID=A0A183EA55_9BILA
LQSSSRSTSDHPTVEAPHSHLEAAPPNVPGPANGQVRKYRGSHRSYKSLLVFLKGLRVPVSKARYRTIESLLDDLNSNISMPFGVRRLTTPRGKTAIKSIDELQHFGRLVNVFVQVKILL